MAYKVYYHKRRRNPRLLIYAAIILLLAGYAVQKSEALEPIRQALLPGRTAVIHLVDNLQNGSSLSGAVSAFCQELWNEAD